MTTKCENSNVCLALIYGQILEYDICDEKGPRLTIYPKDRWEYLGEGTIWSVNGVRQEGKTRLHFWKNTGRYE